MNPSIIFRFDNIPVGAGSVRYELSREKSSVEMAANSGVPSFATTDTVVDCDPALLLGLMVVEEQLEDTVGVTTCSEGSFKLLDTFQEGFINAGNVIIGYRIVTGGNLTSPIFSRSENFGLYQLIVQNDPNSWHQFRETVLPEEGILVKRYLNGILKRVFTLSFESTNWDEQFLWGESKRGQFLINNIDFFRYDAAEKVIDMVAIDKNKKDLESFDIAGSFNGLIPSFPGAPTHNTHYPVYDVDFDSYPGHHAGWVGGTVDYVMRAIYDRSFGAGNWESECDRSTWKFHCGGIDPLCLWSRGAGSPWHLGLRKGTQFSEPVNHYVTTKFRLIKEQADDEDIILHESWFFVGGAIPSFPVRGRYRESQLGQYTFNFYESDWDVATKIAAGLGYLTRYSWKPDGKRRVQHIMRSITPTLVSIPAFREGGSKANPTTKIVDAVQVAPWKEWERFVPFRHIESDNTPGPSQWSVEATLLEPIFDNTKVTLEWDPGLNYYNFQKVRLENNVQRYAAVHQPLLGSNVKKIYEWSVPFGLFANKMGCYFGKDAGVDNGTGNPFLFIPIGVFGEGVFTDSNYWLNNTNDNIFFTLYPGLILYAGRSTTGGKDIDGAATSGDKFYRGCASIEVPYGTNTKRSWSMLEGSAIFMYQFKGGVRETRSLVVPTTYTFENTLGETGEDALYPGLGVDLYGRTMLITRVSMSDETDETEIDVESLMPGVLPDITPQAPTGGSIAWADDWRQIFIDSGGTVHVMDPAKDAVGIP